MEYVPCYQIVTSKGDKVIVKGDLEEWVKSKPNMKWKSNKSGEKTLYAGKYRCEIESLSPETMTAMMYIFQNQKYDPTTIEV